MNYCPNSKQLKDDDDGSGVSPDDLDYSAIVVLEALDVMTGCGITNVAL